MSREDRYPGLGKGIKYFSNIRRNEKGIKFRKRELIVELQKGKRTCGYPAQICFSELFRINISYFEREDSSEYESIKCSD